MTTEELTSWSAATAAAILAFKPIFKGAGDVLNRLREHNAKVSVVQNFTTLQKINDEMDSIEKDIDNVDRVLLFRGHNCGGLPTLERPYHVSLIGKSVDESVETMVREYTNIDTDKTYINMLLDLYRRQVIEYTTSQDDTYHQLKKYYVAEDIKHALIIFLKITKTNDFLYMSVSTKGDEAFTERQKAQIDMKVNSIKTLIGTMK